MTDVWAEKDRWSITPPFHMEKQTHVWVCMCLDARLPAGMQDEIDEEGCGDFIAAAMWVWRR